AYCLFFFQAEDGIRDDLVTGVQTCALPIFTPPAYTARPPLILPGVRGGEPVQTAGTLEVPAGSMLVVRATSAAGLEVSTSGGLRSEERRVGREGGTWRRADAGREYA